MEGVWLEDMYLGLDKKMIGFLKVGIGRWVFRLGRGLIGCWTDDWILWGWDWGTAV